MLAEKLRELTKSTEMLPPLPAVTRHLLEVAKDPKSSAENMGEVISTDLGFSAKLLKLVNSSFYGFSKQISTISRAVVILGYDAVKSLAMGVSAYEVLAKQMSGGPLDHQDFWRHNLAVAAIGKLLAERSKYNPVEEGFVAGLLHDTGKLILGTNAAKVLEAVLLQAKKEPGRDLAEIEQEMLGIDHCVLGGNVFKQWKFPDELVWATRNHHNPETDSTGKTAHLEAIAYLANSLAKIRCVGSSGNDVFPRISKQMMDRLNMDETELLRILLESDGEIAKAASLLNIDFTPREAGGETGQEQAAKILLLGPTPRQVRTVRLVLEAAGYNVSVEFCKSLSPDRVRDEKPGILVVDTRDASLDFDAPEEKVWTGQPVLVLSGPDSRGTNLPAQNATTLVAPFTVQKLLDTVHSLKVPDNG